MTQELTTADGFTLETATNEDHDYENTTDLTKKASIDRWSKGGHDRLYVNGLNWDCYVDLSDGSVHVNGGSKITPVGTELNGDELTITVVFGRKNFPDNTFTFVVTVQGDEFDTDEEEDEETQELVADGGDEDTTEQFTDDEINAAIEQHDDTDHPDATTVADARTSLADIQASFEEWWSQHMDAIDEAHMSIVYETDDVLVLADHTGHGWNEELDELDIDDVTGSVLKSTHYKAAERLCDYSWQSANPFVVVKPDGWQRGEFHVERRVAQLATTADASEAAAMDYWSVEIKGRSQSQWARMVGKSQQTVSENIQKVKDGLGAELS